MPLLSAAPHAAYALKLLVNSSLLNTKNQLTHKLVISYQVDGQISFPKSDLRFEYWRPCICTSAEL